MRRWSHFAAVFAKLTKSIQPVEAARYARLGSIWQISCQRMASSHGAIETRRWSLSLTAGLPNRRTRRLRRERGPRINRHHMETRCCKVSQIVGGHTDDDIRRCGGPSGSKLHQKRLSNVIFHGFWPFSQRERSQLLPCLLLCVVRLHPPTKVIGRGARGCERVELRGHLPGRNSIFGLKLTVGLRKLTRIMRGKRYV